MSAIAAAGITAGAAALTGAGTTLANVRLSKKQAKRNYNYSQMAAEADQRRAIEAFDYYNAYNHPSAAYQRHKEAGLSTSLLYSNGVPQAGGAVSGADSSPDSPQTPQVGDFGAVAQTGIQSSLAASQIDVNKSVANKNNKEAGLAESRERLNDSQTNVNQFLANNYRVTSIGQELTNMLNEANLPNNIKDAELRVKLNEKLLEEYIINIDKATVDLQFTKDTYDVRKEALERDIQLKAGAIVLQRVQASATAKGIQLTDAQISQIKSEIELNINRANALDASANLSDFQAGAAHEQARATRTSAGLTSKHVEWFDTKSVIELVSTIAGTVSNLVGAAAQNID